MPFDDNVLETIGNTPLVKLRKIVGPDDATVLCKLEYTNPGGSVKDRMALHIVEEAERDGRLKPGGTIVENTSGNTGAALAMIAAVKGYRCIFTMPDKMSREKVNTLKAYGAEVVVTPTDVPADSPDSYYETAKRLARETPGSFYVNQYHNAANIEAHYRSTGPEIWKQTGGDIDYLVAGLGTGGTMSGTGKYLKEQKPAIQNIGVDPIGSVYHSLFTTGEPSEPHVYKVEGIGEDMICGALDLSVLDDVRQVNDQDSFTIARRLAREEGLFGGGSSGSAVHVAAQLAREVGKGKTIVTILPDGGRAYISKFYNDEWMHDMGFLDAKAPGDGTVADVLAVKGAEVLTARPTESARIVVERMKREGVSQMPVLTDLGEPIGMIHEADLLSLLLDRRHDLDEAIEGAVHALQGVVRPDTTIAALRDVLVADNVAVVRDGKRIAGIITRIDLIEYLAN